MVHQLLVVTVTVVVVTGTAAWTL